MQRKKFFRIINGILAITAMTLILASSAGAQGKYKTLYRFKGGDGSAPVYTPTFDAAGNLYGATCYGGAYGFGVVFKLAPNPDGSWTESTLHQFTGGDESCPLGGLIFDAAGNLYGANYTGLSPSGPGDIFELTPNSDGTWTETVLYTFTGGADGSSPAGPLVFDAQGNLYGGTMYGGAYATGVVFKLTPNPGGSWTESVLYNFTGGSDGGHFAGSPIFDAVGNLYGTTYWGGGGQCTFGCGTVFKLTPNPDGSWTESVLHRFTGGKDGANPSHNLIFDAAGNLYGATYWGTYYQSCGITCGTVFELTPNPDGSWTTHIPHGFTGGKDGAIPFGNLIIDAAGNLYGTATYGGAENWPAGYGVVFELTPKPTGGWSYHFLHTFQNRPGADPFGGVIFDAAGHLYGTTMGDGSTTFGTIYEITP